MEMNYFSLAKANRTIAVGELARRRAAETRMARGKFNRTASPTRFGSDLIFSSVRLSTLSSL